MLEPTPLLNAFQRLASHGIDRAHAIALVLDGLCLVQAVTRELVPNPEDDNAWHSAAQRLPDPPTYSIEVAAIGRWTELHKAYGSHMLPPRTLGDAYQILQEAPEHSRDTHAHRKSRQQLGSFYTPDAIIDDILDLAWPDNTRSFRLGDPAMGSGHFLLRALPRLGNLRDQRTHAPRMLFGLDNDPVAVRTARQAFWLALSTPRKPFIAPATMLAHADSLLDDPVGWEVGCFDAIVGNPPYEVLTRFKKRPAQAAYAKALRASKRFPFSLTGQINLYRCFIERSLHWLRPGGVLSMIVPAGLLRERHAAKLRNSLLEQHGMDAARTFTEQERVFTGVTQSVTIFRARRDAGPATGIALTRNGDTEILPRRVLDALGPSRIIPHATPADLRWLNWLAKQAPRGFGEIARGYVGEVDQTVYRSCMRDTPPGAILARGEHLQAFSLDTDPTPGKERYLDRNLFLEMKGRSAAVTLARTATKRIAQLGIRNQASRPRLLAARVPANVFAGNSLNLWEPLDPAHFSLVLGLLNSRLYDWRFRLCSGNNNINLYEIEPLPLPAGLCPNAILRIERAVADGEKAAGRNDALVRKRCQQRLNKAVYDLFALPREFRNYLKGE